MSAAAVMMALEAVQVVLNSFESSVAFGAYRCPSSASLDTVISTSAYDYVIIGSGRAGSVIANRLSECANVTILVLEQGVCPPIESQMPGYFPMLSRSKYDYQYTAYNDSFSNQNTQPTGGITAGKMLGGSGSIDHMIYTQGHKEDYDSWGTAANNTSWTYSGGLCSYFAKSENMTDTEILAQNSTMCHGTGGPMKLSRQIDSDIDDVINAHKEFTTWRADCVGQGGCYPTLATDGQSRQCGVSYLIPLIKRKNVVFLTGAEARKIIFDGTTATGVQFNYNGTVYNVTANKKVILTAGAINTPKILMNSGVGDADVLSGLGITPVVNNTQVGQNLMDHAAACFVVGLDNDTDSTAAADPHKFPAPMITYYSARNASQSRPEFQAINLKFPANSSGLIQLLSYGFKFSNSISDKIHQFNMNRKVMLAVANLLHPASTGSVSQNSTDIYGDPIVKLGLFSNRTDIKVLAQLIYDYTQSLLNTTTFVSLGAEFANLGLCTNSTFLSMEYFECYVVEMSSTMWHYCGTCMLGKVVDADLNVIGTTNFKVADASIMESLPSGNIGAAVGAIAEKAADIIKAEDSICSA